MPARHGFRRDVQKGLLPFGPQPSGRNPKQPIKETKSWPGLSPLKSQELLTQRQVLHQEVRTRAKESVQQTKHQAESTEHGKTYNRQRIKPALWKLLKSRTIPVLATDTYELPPTEVQYQTFTAAASASGCTFTHEGCSPCSLYAFPQFQGLGSVLPHRSRDLGFTDFDE